MAYEQISKEFADRMHRNQPTNEILKDAPGFFAENRGKERRNCDMDMSNGKR